MIIIHYQKDKARYEELSKKEKLDDNETKEFNELSRKLITVRDGKLGEWIGYAPLFRSGKEGDELDLEKGIDYNLADKGLGQMGKIMLDFQWNSMRASQGWAKLSLPMYDQPLWKNNGSFFEPPTLRSVSSVVMEIVGTAVGQSWWLGYADDLLFAAMDVGGGYKSASEVGLELAKTAATAAIGAGMGAAGNALGDIAGNALQGASKFTNFAAQAGISMTTNYVTSVANSAVQSLYIDENDLAFNSKNFKKSLYSTETISGALGAGITGGMGAINLRDGNNIKLNSNTFNVSGISAFNSLAGGLVQNGVALAMGGNANFNLLSFKGVGMLEFSFGKDGVKSKIGMGGTNISIQNLRNVAAGYKEASKVTDWKYGSEETSSNLNGINMLGYTTSGMNQQLAKDIWNEKLAVEYGDTGNDYGNYTIGENKIVLSENLLGGGREASAKLATVMSHEGSHYNGNRVEAIAHLAGADTYSQLNEMFKLQADTSFSMEMLSGIMNADNWKENTGDVDHWKFDQNDDGSFGWSWDNDFDFNIGDKTITAEEMKGIITRKKLFENKLFLTGLGLGDLYQSKDKQATFISLTPSESTQAQNEMRNSFIQTSGIDGIKAYEEFILKTEGFADASIAAKQLKNILNQKEINPREVNQYLKQMNTALYAVQNSGLLVKNDPVAIDTTNLIGTGTTSSPYFPLAGYGTENPYVKITSYEGWRLVDKDLAKAGKNYVLNEFSPYYHKGWDGVGSGNIVASLNGGLYLDYLNAEGFQVNNTTELGTFNASHASANTIDQYFSLFGQSGININYNNGTYLLTGLQAGTVIGYMGNTGANTTGAHAHMSLNGSGVQFASVFNNSSYSTNFSSDYYAEYMSGYSYPSMNNNPELWQKVQNYANQRPDLLNWDDFTMHNSEDYMSLFWNKYPRLEK